VQIPRSQVFLSSYLRLLLLAISIGACLFAVRAASAYGVSRLLATYSLSAKNLYAAQKAVALTPQDSEAHFADAVVMGMSNMPEQSIAELEQAIALRPADYTLWQQLGLLRDQAGDKTGAMAAFDESIKRAPFYSQPRWNRGNVLLRSGQYEAAFTDLNQAAQSNPDLIPILLDLAWGVSRGDVKLTEQLTQIKGDKMRLGFAKLLARRGLASEALAQLHQAGTVPANIRQELIDQLLSKGSFKEAFEIWRDSSGVERQNDPGAPLIYNGDFEGPLSFGETGFGWRVPRDLRATSITLDSGQPHSGSRNLTIEFSGNSNPSLSQLIVVESSTRYRINFAGRSRDVVTGGLPLFVVIDAVDSKRLAQSQTLPKGTTTWQSFSFEFTTTPATTAVLLSLQRENCTSSPCPIFGSVSLDSFSVEKLK
jgi:hypothetical protein